MKDAPAPALLSKPDDDDDDKMILSNVRKGT